MLLRGLLQREYGERGQRDRYSAQISGRPGVSSSRGPFSPPLMDEIYLGNRMLVAGLKQSCLLSVNDTDLPTAVRLVAAPGRSVSGDVFAGISDEAGAVSVLHKSGAELRDVGYYSLHQNAIFDLTWVGQKPEQVLTASGDRTLALFDIEAATVLRIFGNHPALRCVEAFNQSPHLSVSCGREGTVCIWDVRDNPGSKFVRTTGVPLVSPRRETNVANRGKRVSTSRALPTKDDNLLAIAGASDGLVSFYDIRSFGTSSRRAKPVKILAPPPEALGGRSQAGVSNISFSPDGSKLAVSYLNTSVAVYDWQQFDINNVQSAEAYRLLRGSEEHPYKCKSFYIETSFSPDGMFLLSGSSDGNAYVWDVFGKSSEPLAMLQGHSAEVSSVQWHPTNIDTVATISDDKTVRFWDINLRLVNMKRDFEVLREVERHSSQMTPPEVQPASGLSIWTSPRLRRPSRRVETEYGGSFGGESESSLEDLLEPHADQAAGIDNELAGTPRGSDGSVGSKRSGNKTLLDFWGSPSLKPRPKKICHEQGR